MILERVQLIDEVVDLCLERRLIVCRCAVPDVSTVFEGHFPCFPVVPGVLLIESIAQASGFLFLAMTGAARMPFLAGVDRSRFRGFVRPGDLLTVTAQLHHEGSGYSIYAGELRRDDDILAVAEIRLSVQDFPNEGMRRHLLERLRSIGAAPSPRQPAPGETVA